MSDDFKHELAALLNRHSRENVSNTPDFMLAEFLVDALGAFERKVTAREKWYGCEHEPGQVDGQLQQVQLYRASVELVVWGTDQNGGTEGQPCARAVPPYDDEQQTDDPCSDKCKRCDFALSDHWDDNRPPKRLLTVTNRRWGGFSLPGGKIHKGEKPEEAARRELMEETGCEAIKLERLGGMVHWTLPKDEGPPWVCLSFITDIGDQKPREVEAGTIPSWTPWSTVLEDGLYPDYYEWLFKALGQCS